MTQGSIRITGSAEFHDGLALPPAFQPVNGSPAGMLPIVRARPALPGGTGAIDHSIVATWDCTGVDKSVRLATT